MKNKIIEYLSNYTIITDRIIDVIENHTFIEYYEKGSVLLKENQKAENCYFVLKGCIRSYYYKDGEEITSDFFTENQSVIPVNYGSNEFSNNYLECSEDCIVTIGNPEIEKDVFSKFPELIELAQAISEKELVKQHQEFIDFKTSTPEERYLNLLKTRPDLFQRVPQFQIASYLGIKPESLSRIRKRTLGK
jgi:CRP-like cAMP-binding protein